MITLNKGALPRRIGQNDVNRLIGESVYWYCSACQQWRTSKIQSDEGIVCPVCGSGPDWKKHQPTLTYMSRYKRVAALCAAGSEWRKSYDELEQRYGDFIDEINFGLPLRSQKAGWRYFHNAWRTVDSLADYLLTASDAPVTDCPYSYSEEGLRRRYFRPRRRYNTTTLSDIRLKHEDDKWWPYTEEETVELLSYRAGFATPFYDQAPVVNELLCAIPVGLEREVAHDFAQGLTKREIEGKYRLSESRVRTIVRHIAKHLRNM